MHSALVIVEMPVSGRQEDRIARGNLSATFLALAQRCSGVQQLGEGCVLITLENNAGALAEVLEIANHNGSQYRVMFFEEAPPWVMSGAGQGSARGAHNAR